MNTGIRRLILLSAIGALVAGGSAQAQKPIDYIGPPIREQSTNVEDDATGSFLVFDAVSGKYMFTRCSDGLRIGGVGVVKTDGCSVTLEDVQKEYRVVASVNECAQEGKALVENFAPESFKVVLLDQNMSNNLMDCASKK